MIILDLHIKINADYVTLRLMQIIDYVILRFFKLVENKIDFLKIRFSWIINLLCFYFLYKQPKQICPSINHNEKYKKKCHTNC